MKPLPFREVKPRLEAAGFIEVGQTGSHINLQGRRVLELALQLFPIIAKSLRERCAAFCVRRA